MGGFALASNSLFATGASPIFVAVRGLNILTANSSDNTVTELSAGRRSGRLHAVPSSPIPVGAKPTAVATADFNGDGVTDLVTANSGGNGVTVLSGAFAVGTSPQSLAIADFNGDGKSDIAVVNSGDGTVTILPEHAARAHYNPFCLRALFGIRNSRQRKLINCRIHLRGFFEQALARALACVERHRRRDHGECRGQPSYARGRILYRTRSLLGGQLAFDAATTVTLNLVLPGHTPASRRQPFRGGE